MEEERRPRAYSVFLKPRGVEDWLFISHVKAADHYEGARIAEGQVIRYLLDNENVVDERVELRGMDTGNVYMSWRRIWEPASAHSFEIYYIYGPGAQLGPIPIEGATSIDDAKRIGIEMIEAESANRAPVKAARIAHNHDDLTEMHSWYSDRGWIG